MTRARPHGRSKSDHRVCQAARYARAAEYRERIGISAEQQEARIAAVNAECDVQDASARRRSQKLGGRKNEARAARGSAWSRSCEGPGRKKKRGNERPVTSLGKPAERVRTEEQELRRLKADLARVEKELQQLRDTSSAREPASDGPGCSSFAPAAWTSTPMSRSLIATLLIIGGIESNPGPTPNEIARKSWVEADPEIETPLLDYLAEQKLNVSNWRKLSPEDRSGFLTKLEAGYQGEWALGWSVFLKAVAAAGTSALDETSGRTQMMNVPAGGSFDTFVPLVGAEGEGINERRRGGFFTPRVNTVHKILLCVQEKGVLILAGSPCSGKTSICQLVYTEAKKSAVYESNSVYYVNCARVGSGGKSFEDAFQDQAGVSFTEASESPPSSPDKQSSRPSGVASSSSSVVQQQKKKLLIIDEAQNTYAQGPGHHLLWPLVKEILAARKDGVNILLSASRGSNPSAVGLPSTPIAFSDDQRIPLRPRPGFTTLLGTNTAEPALQFTMDEYKQVFDTFCARIGFSKDQLQLQTLFDIIEATTERHPGSVLHVLDLLKCRSLSNHSGRAAEWADKQVEFVTSPRLLETLSGTRSFPTVSEFWNDKAALDLISKLLASRGKEYLSVIRNADPDCAEKAEELAKSGYMLLEQNVVSFTSSLHMEFYRYNLARRTWGTPQHMPGTIENFLAEALRKMKPPAFQNSLNLRSRGGVVDGVLEAHFQFELYSAITSLLPEGAYLSPTVGTIYGLQAYVDFVVHGPWKWALELLVDGRDLKEHKARFEPGGRYHPMVLGKQIESWIVVDLRNPNTGRPRRVRGPGVCHVFFDARYEEATIDFGNGNEQKVILTGRA